MSKAIESTLAVMKTAAAKYDSVIVSFSGGKDSIVVLDLCKRFFPKVHAFFMYFIPGLRCVEEGLARFEVMYDIKIARYPHWILYTHLANGTFCDDWHKKDELPEWKLKDIHMLARHDLGAKLVAVGAKKADGAWRRRTIKQLGNPDLYLLPLVEWSKEHVMTYLASRKIPMPSGDSRQNATGVDLSMESVLWMHDLYPDDYQRLLKVFPYAEAYVWRRKFYGIGPTHAQTESKSKIVVPGNEKAGLKLKLKGRQKS